MKEKTVVCLALIIVLVELCPISFFKEADSQLGFKATSSQSVVDWWPMFRHDLTHTGLSTSTGPRTNQTLWAYTQTDSQVFSSPAVADGVVYVGSSRGTVYALDGETGNLLWNYATGTDIGIGGICSSPAVAVGVVYVGSYFSGKVYALNASTGVHVWNYTTRSFVEASPTVTDTAVYVGSDDGNVYALDAKTGALIWNYTTSGFVRSSPAVADGVVYVGSDDGTLYALDAATGASIWNFTTGGSVSSSPAVAGGVVYVGSRDSNMYALDAATGALKWNFTTGDVICSSPAVAVGVVYVGSFFSGKVYALNASTGVHVWNYTTRSFVEASPAVAGGIVYLGDLRHDLDALDAATGTRIWCYDDDSGWLSSPAVANGVVYIGSNNGTVYAFGSPPIPPPSADEMVGATTQLDLLINQLIDPHTNVGSCVNLIANVYETLITFSPDRVDSYVPVLATSWNVTDDGLSYTFTIRQGVKFHNGDIMTPKDVEYSMKRILVTDNIYWSGYLMYDALFGLSGSQDDNGNIIVTAQQLENSVSSTETTVTFHLSKPYPPFLQILSLPCMSIMNEKWCIANGEWPRTWNNWTYYNRRSSLIGQQNTDPPGPHVNAMCGTGPYMLDYFVRGVKYSMVKFNDYWRGWPCPGLKSSISRVTVNQISDWPTIRDMFLAGQLDFVRAPATATNELLGQPGVQCAYPLPTLECDSMLFNFNISTSSPLLGVPNGLPSGTFNESGIPPDLFSDVNVRKGFACAFNYTQFVQEAFLGDALQPATPIIAGLPFYNVDQEKYTQNLTKSTEFLEAAWNGQLWTKGMNMTICVRPGWTETAGENLKSNVENLNPRFHIEIENTDIGTYVHYLYAGEAPIILGGWTADFADPQNFAPSFMDYSFGLWAHFQHFDNSTYQALVKQGISTINKTERQNVYYQLQNLYWEDCIGVPVAQPIGRVFMRDWVHRWSYNQVLGRLDGGLHHFYQEWKENVSPYQLQPGENIVNITDSSGMVIILNTTVPGNLTVTNYDICLEGTAEQGTNVTAMRCVAIETTIPQENITFPIELRSYYTNQEVISSYADQFSLRMFTRNGTKWQVESYSGVVTPSDILGFSGYVWANIWHLSEFAVMGDKTAIHAIVPRDVRPTQTIVGRGYNSTIYSDVFNQGDYAETFNLTFYANSTMIDAIDNVSLPAGNSVTFPIIWSTSGFPTGNYTIACVSTLVTDGTSVLENNYTSTTIIHIGVPGDISGPQGVYDGKVDMRDIGLVARHFGEKVPPADPNWDIYEDGKIDMRDIGIVARHFGEQSP